MLIDFRFKVLSELMVDTPEYLPYEISFCNSIDAFLRIRECLTRIGRLNKNQNKEYLWQVCHIVQDVDTKKYYLVHFKHLYVLSGRDKETTWNDQDLNQLEFIAFKLNQWNMATFNEVLNEPEHCFNLTIVPHRKKQNNEVIFRKKFFLHNKKNKIM